MSQGAGHGLSQGAGAGHGLSQGVQGEYSAGFEGAGHGLSQGMMVQGMRVQGRV